MKKISFILIVSLWVSTLQANAQMRDSTSKMNMYKVNADFLLQKAKKQRTAGWIMLGGGLVLCYASVANAFSDVDFPNGNYNPSDPSSSKITIEEIMAYGGAAAIFTSIPLFIASGKNKRKAELMLKNEALYFNPQFNLKDHVIAIGLKIHL